MKTIEGLLRHAVPWSTFEAATGIDRTTFQRLKQQLDRDGANRRAYSPRYRRSAPAVTRT